MGILFVGHHPDNTDTVAGIAGSNRVSSRCYLVYTVASNEPDTGFAHRRKEFREVAIGETRNESGVCNRKCAARFSQPATRNA